MDNDSPEKPQHKLSVRHKDFARRFEQACDGNRNIPPPNFGRLRWFSEEFEKRFGAVVPAETIRRWTKGYVRPKMEDSLRLAEILKVDAAWLSVGAAVPPDMDQARTIKAVTGIANIIAGFIQIDGGSAAFPADDDDDALARKIDLYAIIRGAKYDITLVPAVGEKGEERFLVPVEAEQNVVLGVVRGEGLTIDVYELDWPNLDEKGSRKGGVIVAQLDAHEWSQITTFTTRI